MVFTSIPAYLDPANWQQQPNHPIVGGTTTTASLSQLPPPPLLPPPQPSQHPQPPSLLQHQQPLHHVGTGAAPMSVTIRPGSMAERARMANITMPETAQKCPRCESTNTKFCYFNNYNLSQPRHFCKTCRRYWTRGGALRNVPVGGGIRRNKRSNKGNSSKSSPATSDRSTGNSSASSNQNSTASVADILGLTNSHIPPLRYMAPFHHLSEFGHGITGELGLNYGGISAPMALTSEMSTFHLGANGGIGGTAGGTAGGLGSSLLSSAGLEQWRLNQGSHFPFLANLDAPSNLYNFEGSHIDLSNLNMGGAGQLRPKFLDSAGSNTQVPPVKNEVTNEALNLSSSARQFIGIQGSNNDQFNWIGNGNPPAAWSDISGLNSSSTGSAL